MDGLPGEPGLEGTPGIDGRKGEPGKDGISGTCNAQMPHLACASIIYN